MPSAAAPNQRFAKFLAFFVDKSGKRRSPQSSAFGCDAISCIRSRGAEHVKIAIAEATVRVIEVLNRFLLIGLHCDDCLLKQRLGLGGGAGGLAQRQNP